MNIEATAQVEHEAFEPYTLNLRRERRGLYVWRTAGGSSVAFGSTVDKANAKLREAYANPGPRGPRLVSVDLPKLSPIDPGAYASTDIMRTPFGVAGRK